MKTRGGGVLAVSEINERRDVTQNKTEIKRKEKIE